MTYSWALWIVRVILFILIAVEIAGLLGAFPSIDSRVWPGVIIVGVLAWAALEAADRWMQTHNLVRPPALAILLGLAVVFIDTSGNLANWYSSVSSFDLLVHAASGMAITIALYYVAQDVAQQFRLNAGKFYWCYFAWTTMMTLAALFEIGEWVADLIFASTFWLGNAQDTVTDLLAAGIAGLVAILVLWQREPARDYKQE